MGIRNRDGALFMATGIDNSGLYADRREAMGIIKAMASEITSFDIFSGIGISAATAFASAAKSSYDFEKEFRKNMLEVATISTQVEGSMTDFMNQVMAITQQVPIKAPDAAKALYQIVSAGHDGAAGMNVLEVAAKSAVGGITDTVTAADAITTLLNAYKLSADDAEKVSDQLFTTARLGKTTFGELGQSIAQVAPIAAAYGVEMDQVLAAVATLTKSGTPTAQAMTQIRASIIGTSKVLGDGAFDSMTFQEALAEIANRAGGSEAKLRELIPEVEAVNGVLGLTGIKAQDAAEHLNAMNESAGATEAAFNKMQEDVGNQMILISNNIQAALRPMGSAILKNVSEAAQMINKGFETGQIQSSMETLQKLLVAVAGAFVTYKSAAIGASTAEALHSAKVTISNNLKSLQSQITGEAALSKEKERIHLEAYTTSLGKSITEEQRAKLAKLDLKAGSQEYMKALSEQALQEKKNADNQVESLTKVVNKNKEKLSSAQENLEMSHQVVEAAKAELNTAIEANDSIGFEVAQTKMNAAAQREEAASTNVSVASKRLKSSETRLTTATTVAETATTRVNTATTVADTAVTNIATTAKNRLKVATIALWGAMKANPLGAVLTAVSLAATVYMVLANRTDDLTTAQGRLKKNTDDFESSITSERIQIDILFGKLNAARKGTDDYRKAKEAILNKYGKYLEGLNEEVKSLENVSDAYKAISNAAVQAAKDRAIEKGTQDASDAYANDWKDNITQIREQFVDKFGELKGEELFYKLRQSLADGLDLTPELEKSISKFDKYIYNRSTGSNDNNNPVERLVKNIKISKRKLDDELEDINASFGKLMKVSEEGGSDPKGGPTGKPTIEIASITKEVKAATQKVSILKQELADLRSGKTSAEAGKTVKETIDAKLTELKAAEDALSTLTGKDTATDKKASDEQKKALEARKKLNEELLSLRMQNQQAEINLMAEGREKRLAQIEFDYDSEIAVILAKEKEWKEAQGGKLTEDQTKEVHVSFFNSYVKKEKSSALVDKDQLEAEKQAMNEYLVAYGNYQEKRKAITEKYNDLMAKATTEGEKLSLGKELTKSLSDLDIEANKSTSAISALFDDMSKKTVEDLHAIADAGEKALQFLRNGQWDATTGANLGMSEETFKTLKDSPEELDAIVKAIVKIREEADQCETSFNKISGGLTKVFSAGDDNKKLKEGLEEIGQGMNDVMQAGQFLADSFSAIGDAFGSDLMSGVADGLNVAMDAMSSAMEGAKAGAMFGPIGAAAGAAIGAVTSLASSIAKIHDSKNEKRIQRLQDQIETLDKSYEILGDAIDKAYSKDASKLIEQQNTLLEQQKVLIQQQIREEDDKKKTDHGKIKDWQNQLDEIDKTLAGNKEKAVDAIFGEDLQSAIDNFAQAYADAWASGEDRAKSMKDVARNMIRSTIVEMIKSSAGLGETVKKIRSMIEGYLTDGVINDWEQGQLDAYIESETAKLDAKYGWADKYMKEDKEFDLGISSDSIADTIAEGLAAGKSGFKDFAGSFEDMMRTAVINSLKTKHLEGPLKEFQKKFSELSESGGQLTEAEIEELRGMYADIIDGAKVQFDSLKDIAGLDFTADSDNSLKGAYAKASQESITLLAGQTGAQRVIMEDIRNNMIPIREQMLAIREMNSKGWEDVKAIKELTTKIDKNTERVAENTRQIKEVADKVADNTRNTVDALEGTINVKIKGM